jgi:hypothetical protein
MQFELFHKNLYSFYTTLCVLHSHPPIRFFSVAYIVIFTKEINAVSLRRENRGGIGVGGAEYQLCRRDKKCIQYCGWEI